MMKVVISLIVCGLFVLMATSTQGQDNTIWSIDSIQTFPLDVSLPFQVSSDGRHVITSNVMLEVWDLSNQTMTFNYFRQAQLSDWLNGTLIYQERSSLVVDQPTCVASGQMTFGFYSTESNVNTIYCTTPPQAYVQQTPYNDVNLGGRLYRIPFDPQAVLVDERFRYELSTNQWTDLASFLSNNISRATIQDAIGYGQLWWNATTQLPIGRVRWRSQINNSQIEEQYIEICPVSLEAEICDIITSVSPLVHGLVRDITVSADGNTLFWSAEVWPDNEVLTATGSPDVINFVAFATDVLTGATTQIFQLYAIDNLTGQGQPGSNDYTGIWSPNGEVLVISYRGTPGDDHSLVVVKFQQSGS